jgi:hypothetical protein
MTTFADLETGANSADDKTHIPFPALGLMNLE